MSLVSTAAAYRKTGPAGRKEVSEKGLEVFLREIKVD